jgi:hypothetical protein
MGPDTRLIFKLVALVVGVFLIFVVALVGRFLSAGMHGVLLGIGLAVVFGLLSWTTRRFRGGRSARRRLPGRTY